MTELSEFKLLGILVFIFALVIVLICLLNLPRRTRYMQAGNPILALLVAVIVIWADRNILSLIDLRHVENLINNYAGYLNIHLSMNLQGLEFLILNFIILIVFLGLKSSYNTACRLYTMLKKCYLWIKSKLLLLIKVPDRQKPSGSTANKDISIAYRFVPGSGILLKAEWVFIGTLFGWLSLIPLLLLLFIILSYVFPSLGNLIGFLPRYPAISFLVLAEAAWFLGGQRLSEAEKSIGGYGPGSRMVADYSSLWDYYQKTWPDRALIAKQWANASPHLQEISSLDLNNPGNKNKFNTIINDIAQKGLIVNHNYKMILRDLLEGRDILVDDPVFDELAPYLFAVLHTTLTNNKKILVVLNEDSNIDQIINWFRKNLNKSGSPEWLWRVATYDYCLKEKVEPDILIITPDQLVRHTLFSADLDWMTDVAVVLLPEGRNTISRHTVILHCLAMRLSYYLGRKPQYIIFSAWCRDLEHTLRDMLGSRPEEFTTSPVQSKKIHFIAWRLEGDTWYQSKVLPHLTHYYLDAEPILSLPALKYGVDPVYLVCQDNQPWHETIEEMCNNHRHLFEYEIPPDLIEKVRDLLVVAETSWLVSAREDFFVLARDNCRNLVQTLSEWWSMGRENCFVQVISPPYLLRDYLAFNIDYFILNKHKIFAVSPRLSYSRWNTAYILWLLLSHSYLKEQEIDFILKKSGISTNTNSVTDAMIDLFQSAFGRDNDYCCSLETETSHLFDENTFDFKTVVRYKYSAAAGKWVIGRWLTFYELRDETGNVLTMVLGSHIYQNFLKDQFHAFRGKWYRIVSIDNESRVINAKFETPSSPPIYLQTRLYTLGDGFEKNSISLQNRQIGGICLSTGIVEMKFTVNTPGYFTFFRGIDLSGEDLEYSYLENNDDGTTREYVNGRLLLIDIRMGNRLPGNRDKIAFSLCLLFNEIFPTLFPNSHQYLAACACLPHDFFNKDNIISARMEKLSPQICFPQFEHEENTISLFIIEDSYIDMGLLESIKENLTHIFEILDDYLEWLDEPPGKAKRAESEDASRTSVSQGPAGESYLKYGSKDYPRELDLPGTLKTIRCLLGSVNKLRDSRKTFYNNDGGTRRIPDPGMESRRCDFCDEVMLTVEIERLDDGRERCRRCRETAINSVDKLQPLYQKVRQYFARDLGQRLREDIHLKMVSAAELNSASGTRFLPTSSFDPRMVGLAVRAEPDVLILIENGAPKTQSLMTLAHEMTHIWQYDNLNVEAMSLEEIEGHASWTEIEFLETYGDTTSADKKKAELANRNDEYGNGYRLVLDLLKKQGVNSPFELFLSRYPYGVIK